MTKEAVHALLTHAEAAYPDECVGALLRDGTLRALTNVAADRRSGFLVSAKDTIALLSSCDVSGYYHSHPDGPAVPSPEDAAHVSEGSLVLISSVMNGVASPPRAFRFTGGRFAEEAIHHESSDSPA